MLMPACLLTSVLTPSPPVTAEFSRQLTRIGSGALDSDPLKQRRELRFPVTIQLEDQQLKLKGGLSLPLQVGTSLTENIKLHKVSYLQLLLGELQGKAEMLQRL